jgi:hypothetical protein
VDTDLDVIIVEDDDNDTHTDTDGDTQMTDIENSDNTSDTSDFEKGVKKDTAMSEKTLQHIFETGITLIHKSVAKSINFKCLKHICIFFLLFIYCYLYIFIFTLEQTAEIINNSTTNIPEYLLKGINLYYTVQQNANPTLIFH